MTRAAHLPVLTLLAAALFLRVLVPVGWMPATDGKALLIQPCPAADVLVHGDGASHHHQGSSHAVHDGDCAFSPLHAAVAQVDVAPPIVPRVAEADEPLAHAPLTSFPTGPPALPPPATGPPTLT